MNQYSEASGSAVTFRRLARPDFPFLAGWLAAPHVARWWHHETTAEAVERDFGPAVDGAEPAEDWLAQLAGEPLGLVQCCRIADYPEYAEEIQALVPVPEQALTIDYLIGPPDQVGRGVGPVMVAAFCEAAWRQHPRSDSILVPVTAANRASWRALEKAGFRRVATGEMEPDNPVDDRLHHVYRLDRPAGARSP